MKRYLLAFVFILFSALITPAQEPAFGTVLKAGGTTFTYLSGTGWLATNLTSQEEETPAVETAPLYYTSGTATIKLSGNDEPSGPGRATIDGIDYVWSDSLDQWIEIRE